MKLTDYLKNRDEKPYQFAKRAGINYELAYALANGEDKNIHAKTILRIIKATGGQVTFEDLI